MKLLRQLLGLHPQRSISEIGGGSLQDPAVPLMGFSLIWFAFKGDNCIYYTN